MNKEIKSIIQNIKNVNNGQPWFGRPVYEMLDEIDPESVYQKPNDHSHSMIELLWHMITWSEFALRSLEKANKENINAIEAQDWRNIDPSFHTWQKGLEIFKNTHRQITDILDKKNDDFLKEIVGQRKFNFRFMLNGLIQHNIYHLGQIVYTGKLLS